MKKPFAVIFFVTLILFLAALHGALAVSETFELPPLHTVNRYVTLQENDRLTVTLNIDNTEAATVISVRILDPQMRLSLSYTLTYNNDSFTFLAPESGEYTIGFVYENSNTQVDSLPITVKYEIELGYSKPEPTPENKKPNLDLSIAILTSVIVSVVILSAVILNRRRSRLTIN